MENISFETIVSAANGEEIEYAIIDHGNGEFTSMLKSTYEAQQAAQATLVTESAPTA